MRNLDKMLVVDVEATCWNNDGKSMLPRREDSEIIEIGVCTIDLKTLEISPGEGIIVKPVDTEVSEFCTQLTTLTQADVDKGISFEDACNILRKKYNSKNRLWSSYGKYDDNIFQRECAKKNVKYPFGSFHINIKGIIESVYGRTLGMAEALEKMGIVLDGVHHRGCDDAYNTAKIYAWFLASVRQHLHSAECRRLMLEAGAAGDKEKEAY